MVEEISSRNTKNEILDAYYELLEHIKQNKKSNKQEEKLLADQKAVVDKAVNQSADDIIKGLANLKLIINQSFKDLEDQLLAENQKLVNLKQAITICNQELEDLYDIKVNVDSLAALLLAQKDKAANFDKNIKERSAAFEQEMQDKRSAWKKEQEDFELAIKEQETLTKKLRVREEEEYVYKRNLTRAKEQDQYLLEKQSLEKELAEKRVSLEQEFKGREQQVAAAEKELRELQMQVETLQAEKQQAILDTENRITQTLTLKYEYEAKLAQTKVEGESKVYKQIIANLEAKVANLEAQISQFTERANQANLQVQDIAIKAIDGASRQRYFQLEKAVEVAKPTTV